MRRIVGWKSAASSTPTASGAARSKKPSPWRAEPIEDDFDPEHRVGHLLRRAYHLAKNNTSEGLRDIGVTPMQASAIMALRRDGPLSQAMLGRAIGMEPANVHGLVARLRKQRLVRAAPHPTDQRSLCITLTAAGERHASAIAHISAASAEATLQPLSPDERVVFLALLRRIASGIS
jgi:DNA-binding MarR family transcriptional regulator